MVVFVSLGDASVDGAELGVHGGHGEPVGKEERRGKWSRASGDGELWSSWCPSPAEARQRRGKGAPGSVHARERHGGSGARA